MIEIFKNNPPKKYYKEIKRYQNVEFKKKYSIELLERFFREFPEEKRGRKKFKDKEIQNIKHLIYENIFRKGIKIKADCIGLIREKVDRNIITIKVSFLKKMDENKILFVDLDGTLIREDLSNLAFINFLKNNPLKLIFYLLIFIIRGKPYLKEKISENFNVPINKLTFNKSALKYIRDVKNRHRVVYLISGSHQILVDQIDQHLKFFLSLLAQKIILIWLEKIKLNLLMKN